MPKQLQQAFVKVFLFRKILAALVLAFVCIAVSTGTIFAASSPSRVTLASRPTSVHAPARTLLFSSSCPQPPQHVDLMTLSDDELQLYGLPLHTVLDSDPGQWKQRLAYLQQHICGSTSTEPASLFERNNLYLAWSQPPPGMNTSRTPSELDGGEKHTNIWAGLEGALPTKPSVEATFNVPFISLANSKAEVAVWVGIGGDGTPPLVQAGIDASIVNGKQQNYAFWQIVPNMSLGQILLPQLNAGDRVFVYVTQSLWGDNYFYIEDMTTGDFSSTWKHTDPFSGVVPAECIVERPTQQDGQISPLADFNPHAGRLAHTITINGCQTGTVGEVPFGIGNIEHNRLLMNAPGWLDQWIPNQEILPGQLLADPGEANSKGDFQVSWVASN